MSAQVPSNYAEWFKNLPLPSTSGPVGQLEAACNGAIVDNYVALLKTAVKAKFPDTAPVDALPHIGNDRGLVQGANESNTSFVSRLIDAWGQWSRAGTWTGLLEQLYYFGFATGTNGTIIVQQNGLATYLSGNPTPGQDPSALTVDVACPALATALTSNVLPPTLASAGRIIPAGTAWWQIAESASSNTNASDTDFCNRFAILLPSWPFSSITTAYFNATDNVAITWPVSFGSSTYSIQIGTPVVTDGGGGVVLHADGATQTATGVTIRSSAPFTGYASVVAYAAGVNPLNTFGSTSVGTLQKIIKLWRPNSICTGVYIAMLGKFMGWPVQAQSSNTMQTCSIVRIGVD
jgi:hypothetical protein